MTEGATDEELLVPDTGGDPLAPHDVYVDGVVTKLPRWQHWAHAAKARLEALRHAAVAAQPPVAA